MGKRDFLFFNLLTMFLVSEIHSTISMPPNMEVHGVAVSTLNEVSVRIADESDNPIDGNLRVVFDNSNVKSSIRKGDIGIILFWNL